MRMNSRKNAHLTDFLLLVISVNKGINKAKYSTYCAQLNKHQTYIRKQRQNKGALKFVSRSSLT